MALQFLFGLSSVRLALAFDVPPGVKTWCGKAYRAEDSSFDPGGQLSPPKTNLSMPLLDLSFYPRMSLYLDDEKTGSFIVDAPISFTSGLSLGNFSVEDELNITIKNTLTGERLVRWSTIRINSTGNEFPFNLSSLPARIAPYPVSILTTSPNGLETHQSTSRLTILPTRNDTGSVSRIDHLYDALQVLSPLTHRTWKSIFPYSFYTSWDWIASTINNSSSTYNLSSFKAAGYNIIHPIPPGGTEPFNQTILRKFLKICNELELYIMYDMRHTYQNLSSISSQLASLQPHPSLLLYYTADEPDGTSDPLNATERSYNHIKSIDPYHPVSLVLNCENFFFEEYVKGTDIVLEDTYSIAANTSYSVVYHTPCNSTYGDCGCDNCHALDRAYTEFAENAFLDITTRVDTFYTYQEWLGYGAKKPVWGAPQAFFDQGSFWDRFLTADEHVVSSVLRLNHGVKGLVAWMFPTSDELRDITGKLATVLTSPSVTEFILGAERIPLLVNGGNGMIDATAWARDRSILVSVVNMGYKDIAERVEVRLPGVGGWQFGMEAVIWGSREGWEVYNELTKEGVRGLEVGVFRLGFDIKG
ncbi:hypothetical protein GQ43DRAFT_484644 [Delitschia confertaspora ATCC 74209]|uniref:Glycoside hydrolase family 42 N-terminal domain-containing protein n=1 Tax=Delitschia confertaspora ATCC 74209 TaxID=1513339 RepID=A0A9P4MRB0_9PLEO|nr:hypothetical protein GQ43DRAFT_484644 [Delitschia confertaspora ATCC 74209]